MFTLHKTLIYGYYYEAFLKMIFQLANGRCQSDLKYLIPNHSPPTGKI